LSGPVDVPCPPRLTFPPPCSKRKIGDDPNNTKWARNTDSFGHKLLRSQGWEPGQYLGQKDAAHAASYTAASSSHIRAILREDNLGIGASGPGANTANECTGLDIFKDLLGRLNGKSEAVIEKQRQARENVKMTLYVERRFGPMRFVRGGFLIGDDETPEGTEELAATEEATATAESTPSTSETEAESDAKEARRTPKKERKEKKKEKSRKRKANSDAEEADNSDEANDSDRKDRKRKRSKGDVEDKEKVEKKKSKKDRKEKKEKQEKRDKKDKSEKKEKKDTKRRRGEEMDVDTATPSESEKPASAVPSSFTASSRNLARRRYINQKRAAVADPQALKQVSQHPFPAYPRIRRTTINMCQQIFMIKA
jgi:Pin2-interacting protein X1